MLGIRRLHIGKRSLSAPPPQRQRLFAIRSAQFCCHLDQYPEDHSAIVVCEFDEP